VRNFEKGMRMNGRYMHCIKWEILAYPMCLLVYLIIMLHNLKEGEMGRTCSTHAGDE
jgi:hypothetical protein